jgi:hypothetical protein
VLPCRIKHKTADQGGATFDQKYFISGRYIFSTSAERITSCIEYDADYPGDSLCFTYGNGTIYQSASLKSVTPDEIPEPFRDPVRIMMGLEGAAESRPGNSFPGNRSVPYVIIFIAMADNIWHGR